MTSLLFALDHPGFLLHFDETIGRLADRGITVHVGFARPEKWPHGLHSIDRSNPNIVVHEPIPARTTLPRVARGIRRLADYVHYLDPALADAVYARAKWRALARFPGPLALLRARDTLPRPVVRMLLRLIGLAERALPRDRDIRRFIAAVRPDAVIVSPLVDARTDLTDYLRAAAGNRIPTALCVASWDNLSSKGLIRVVPDRVLVWNETQRREAIEFHRVPGPRITLTGAQPYDRWFERRPSKSRAEFEQRHGLPQGRPVILFAGSTKQAQSTELEPDFVRHWAAAIRSSELADAAILVRPHPTNAASWRGVELDDVVVWHREEGLPIDEAARAEYYDSLYYAAAVVAINSTALIEAAILNRPAHAVALPEFRALQHDLLHYRYLLPENGGFLQEAPTLADHVRLLAEDMRRPERLEAERLRFVKSFIRPFGLDVPATPRLVSELAGLGH